MMDAVEAIKGLEGYAETLVGLSALLDAKMFEEKSNEHEGLLALIKEKQKDGRWIALEIMKHIQRVGTKADRSGELTGTSAAIQRFVVADKQASESLKKGDKANAPTEVRDAVDRFRKSAGLDF